MVLKLYRCFLIIFSTYVVLSSAFDCLGNTCEPEEYCTITLHSSGLRGECVDGDDDERPRLCSNISVVDFRKCSCRSSSCAAAVVTLTKALSRLPHPYECLDKHCLASHYCHLHLGSDDDNSDKIVSECVRSQKPNTMNCTDHNSVSNIGCYCDSPECVNKIVSSSVGLSTALDCLGKKCESDEYCTITSHPSGLHSTCDDVEVDDDGESPPLCSAISLANFRQCICRENRCVSTLLKATSGHSTTLTEASTVTTPPTTTQSTTSPTKSTTQPLTSTPEPTTTIVPPSTTQPPTSSPAPTTKIASPPSTTQPPTSTSEPTTTIVPPSTTQPATASVVPTTKIASTRKCHICGDRSYGIPCSMKEINNNPSTLCPSGDYCMTDIFQDVHGNLDVYKRCVDMATCEKEWIHETADHDYCKRYGTIINPGAFSCHFCCDADGCNNRILPSSSTWYSTQNGK